MRVRFFMPVLCTVLAATLVLAYFLPDATHGSPAVHVPLTRRDILTRLFVITLLSGLIGMEREYHAKPAGLRTNVLVGLGACLMTVTSVLAIDAFPDKTIDPTRIPGQIITGIGFIGAGAILRPSSDQGHLIGLTTSATLLVVCGLGIAIGLGFYSEAIATTALVFFTFFVMSKMVGKLREYTKLFPPKTDHDLDDVTVKAVSEETKKER